MRDFNRSSERRFAPRGNGGRRDFNSRGDRPEMHEAICDECGKNCRVPFRPTGNKEVFCSDCFDRRGGNDAAPRRYDESFGNRPGRGSSNFERSGRGERIEFTATCDECGKSCKLPFRPTSSKPVYCSDCFEMRGERSGLSKGNEKHSDTGKEFRELRDQIISLNTKLDKIMKALDIKPEKQVAAKTVKVSKEDFTAATEEAPVAEVAPEAEEVVVDTKVKKTTAKKAVAKKTATKKVAAKKAK